MRKLFVLAAALLTLAACGASPSAAPATGAPTPASTGPEAPAQPPTASPPSVQQPAQPSPAAAQGGAGEVPPAVLSQAQQRLAPRLGLQPADLIPIEGEAVEWSDGSLGCPDPAATYLQVITPGYRLTLLAPDGLAHDLRSDESGGQIVLCENGRPTILDPSEMERQP